MEGHRHGHAHGGGFDPAWLLAHEEDRRARLDPEAILDHVIFAPDVHLVDIGCGVGFFTLPAARRLPAGRVYAIDIHPEMVRVTAERARQAGLNNVVALVADATRLPLPDESAHVAFLGMVLHDFAQREQALAEVRRVLTPGGRVHFVEWAKEEEPGHGPPVDIRFTPDELATLLQAADLQVEELRLTPRPFYQVTARKRRLPPAAE